MAFWSLLLPRPCISHAGTCLFLCDRPFLGNSPVRSMLHQPPPYSYSRNKPNRFVLIHLLVGIRVQTTLLSSFPFSVLRLFRRIVSVLTSITSFISPIPLLPLFSFQLLSVEYSIDPLPSWLSHAIREIDKDLVRAGAYLLPPSFFCKR